MIELLQSALGGGKELSFCLSGDGRRRNGLAVVRVFRPGETRPAWIAKVPRDGAASTALRREHELLTALEEAAPALAGRRWPRADRLLLHDGRAVTVQSPLDGRPLRDSLRPGDADAAREVLQAAREWLTTFWNGTGLLEGGEAALWEPFLRAAYAWGDGDDELAGPLGVLTRGIEARRGRTALAGFGHGDLTAARMLRTRRGAAAIGWIHGRTRQLPWVDAVTIALDVAARTDGFDAAFVDEGPLRDAVTEFLLDTLAEGGVPDDVLPLVVPAVAVLRARRAARRGSSLYPAALAWAGLARRALEHLATCSRAGLRA